MFHIHRLAAAAAVVATLGFASQAGAQTVETALDAKRITMVHDIPGSHPRIKYFNRMVEAVREHSQGKVDVTINPGSVVLPGKASLDAVREGRANLAWINAAHLEQVDFRAGFLNLPFGVNDDNMSSGDSTDRVLALMNQILRDKGLVALGMMRGADQLFIFKDKHVRSPEDLNGLKVRVAGSGIYEEVMQALGVDPIVIPIPQVRDALANRDLDGIFTSPGGWKTTAGVQLQKAARIPGLMFITYLLVADVDWFEGLPHEAREVIRQAARSEVTGRWSEMQRDDEQVLRDLSAQGAEIWMAQKRDEPPWRARVDGIMTRFSDRAPETAKAFQKIVGR